MYIYIYICFKIRCRGNMFVFITRSKIMIVKFVCGCSAATRSYIIIPSVSKIYFFASYVVLPLQQLHDKNIKH